ncbi:MAG: peptidase U32 family protein [bacterium]|nr:peptidase U32 family protein [bacterium]
MKTSDIELLAPAGSFESLQAAINAGCDAVYFGIGNLNMRAKAALNFELDDLPEIRRRCSKANIRCFVVVNTLLYENDMTLMRRIIDAARENGMDGVFLADMASIMYANSIGIETHISTQLSISNYETVKFWSRYSDRVVLARELNLQMIKAIHEQIVVNDLRGPKGNLMEIEIFAHGALCVAISGRCGMSLYSYNSSANRGACKQNCRKAYKVTDLETGKELVIDNEYVMSPKDICTIHFLDQLIDTGVKVLKIEGRGRSPDYVDRVIRCYREALDSLEENTYTEEKINDWRQQLGTVYHRGMSDGYYLGRPLGEWSGTYGSKATQEKHFVGRIQKYYPKSQVAELLTEALEISEGDEFVITGANTGVVRGSISELRLDERGQIKSAARKQIVTFPLKDRVRKNDKLYILKKRVAEQQPKITIES